MLWPATPPVWSTAMGDWPRDPIAVLGHLVDAHDGDEASLDSPLVSADDLRRHHVVLHAQPFRRPGHTHPGEAPK